MAFTPRSRDPPPLVSLVQKPTAWFVIEMNDTFKKFTLHQTIALLQHVFCVHLAFFSFTYLKKNLC